MKNTYRIMSAAMAINPNVYEADAVDTVRQYVEDAGWAWAEPQVVLDPAGCPHYITAESGFAEQVAQVYELHQELTHYGLL